MQIIYCGIKMAGCDSYHTEYDDFGEYLEVLEDSTDKE